MRIVIDGNIGSGKTTQINLLRESGYNTFKEPIDDWPLDLFYSDQKKWALNLQVSILKSYANPPEDAIFERCPESSRNVFWNQLKGVVSDVDNTFYEILFSKFKWKPDLYIYLESDPEKCLERIQKRFQNGDQSISLQYLQSIHTKYEYMYKKYIMDNVVFVHVENKTRDDIHQEVDACIRMWNDLNK